MTDTSPPPHGSPRPSGPGDRIGRIAPGACADPPILDQRFDAHSLYALRSAVGAHAAHAGMPHGRTDDIVIAVHELAANAVRHGAGAGRLRIWKTGGELLCQVDDDGPPAPPDRAGGEARRNVQDTDRGGGEHAADRNLADLWPYQHGHGLWLVRQAADRLDLYSDSRGTRATIAFTLPSPERSPFRLTRRGESGCVVLSVHGDLERPSASALISAIGDLVAGGPAPLRLVLDLTGMTFWDSYGLSTLITAQRRIDRHPPATMIISGLPAAVRRRLRVGGLADHLVFTDTTDQALRRLAPGTST